MLLPNTLMDISACTAHGSGISQLSSLRSNTGAEWLRSAMQHHIICAEHLLLWLMHEASGPRVRLEHVWARQHLACLSQAQDDLLALSLLSSATWSQQLLALGICEQDAGLQLCLRNLAMQVCIGFALQDAHLRGMQILPLSAACSLHRHGMHDARPRASELMQVLQPLCSGKDRHKPLHHAFRATLNSMQQLCDARKCQGFTSRCTSFSQAEGAAAPEALSITSTQMGLPHLALIWSPDRYLAANSVVQRLCRLWRHSSQSGSRQPGLLPATCECQAAAVPGDPATRAPAVTYKQVWRKARRHSCPPRDPKCASLGRLSSRRVSSAAWRTTSGVVYRRLAKAGSVTNEMMRSCTAACTTLGDSGCDHQAEVAGSSGCDPGGQPGLSRQPGCAGLQCCFAVRAACTQPSPVLVSSDGLGGLTSKAGPGASSGCTSRSASQDGRILVRASIGPWGT